MTNPAPPISIVDTAAAIRDGRVTAVAVARAALNRHVERSDLGALACVDAEDVLRQASALDRALVAGSLMGPLHGVPLVIKDNIHVADVPNAAGTPALAGFIPANDAVAVARLRAAGAVILGKTRMHELAMGWTGQSYHSVETHNPHDLRRMAGGSSGGTAAAIGAGIVAGGLGTDTNGSIRIPAAFCGVAGLRPSQGRIPIDGVTPLAPSLDTVGPLANDITGLAALYGVLAREVVPDLHDLAGLRFGVVPGFFELDLSADTRSMFEHVQHRLAAAGAELVAVNIDLAELVAGAAPATIAYESYAALTAYLSRFHPQVTMSALVAVSGADLRRSLRPSDPSIQMAYRSAQQQRSGLSRLLDETFMQQGIEGLLYPTTPMAAPLLQRDRLISPAPDVEVDGAVMPARIAFARNISPSSLAGLPSLTIPVRNRGLPIGLQLDGPRGGDARLLAIGRLLETFMSF